LAITHATEKLCTSTYSYNAGEEYPLARQEGTPQSGEITWDTANPVTFTCPKWTPDFAAIIVEFDVPIVNSIDNGIYDTIKGPCSYAACSNKLAFANGDLK
jgi:hypothetical protein